MKPKIFVFEVNFPGEFSAGLWPFREIIEIKVESGDLGGFEDDFVDAMQKTLREHYDGAYVSLAKIE